MKIRLTGLYVDDQTKALQFYTEKLGFAKKMDISAGGYRWLTVVSSEDASGPQLVLEPNANPAAQTYQAALKAQGLRAATFFVDDLDAEVARLQALGVKFTQPPTKVTGSKIAILDDTCGNLVQLTQLDRPA